MCLQIVYIQYICFNRHWITHNGCYAIQPDQTERTHQNKKGEDIILNNLRNSYNKSDFQTIKERTWRNVMIKTKKITNDKKYFISEFKATLKICDLKAKYFSVLGFHQRSS